MSTKPKFFLLDAGPVIELHKLGLWGSVIDRAGIVVPTVIAEVESIFAPSPDGVGHPIDLRPDIDAGRVELVEGTPEQIQRVASRLDPTIRIQAGELEAIALLADWPVEPVPEFCTADGMAVKALCILGLFELPVSLEEMLRRLGLERRLADRFTSGKMQRWIDEGRRRYLTGRPFS